MVHTITLAASAAALLPLAAAQYGHPYGGQIVMYSDNDVAERIDPILAPGTVSQHVHLLFGSNAVAPGSDYDELQQKTTCTTLGMDGDGIKDDNSAYWHPALYMETANNTGYIRVPTDYHKLYYSDHGSLKDDIVEPFEFPKGFRMLANSPFMRAPNPDKAKWGRTTQWVCHGNPGYSEGDKGGFPTGISSCYYGFVGSIHFPHCWNGNDFNPLDPTAHVSYPDGDPESGECPDTHKKRVPHIFMENYFTLDDKFSKQVKPGSFVLAQGDNTGYGFHGDFFNGWAEGKLAAQFARCNQHNQTQGISTCDDVGSNHVKGQGGFNRNGIEPGDCHITPSFNENVDYPGKFLPGCNPIIDTDPAPIMQIAAVGISTDLCNPISGGGSPSAAGSSAAPASSSAASPSSAAQAAAYSPPASSSTTQIMTSASTSDAQAAPTGSTSADSVDCPGDDGKTYTTNGKTFQVECGIDHVAGNLDMLYANNLSACIGACASHSDCVDVSLSGTACWMKKTLGEAVNRKEVSGAKVISGAGASQVASSVESLLTTTTVVPTSTMGMPAGETVWVTEEVTVTAYQPVYTNQARDEEAVRVHMHQHAKYHVGRRAF